MTLMFMLMLAPAHAHDVLVVNATSFVAHAAQLCALPWTVLMVQEARCMWGCAALRELRKEGVQMLWGPQTSGRATCLVLARAGKLVRREWPECAPGDGLHCVWRAPDGTPWRLFNVYVAPREGGAAAYAAARGCVAEAMRSPQVPALVAGDF